MCVQEHVLLWQDDQSLTNGQTHMAMRTLEPQAIGDPEEY